MAKNKIETGTGFEFVGKRIAKELEKLRDVENWLEYAEKSKEPLDPEARIIVAVKAGKVMPEITATAQPASYTFYLHAYESGKDGELKELRFKPSVNQTAASRAVLLDGDVEVLRHVVTAALKEQRRADAEAAQFPGPNAALERREQALRRPVINKFYALVIESKPLDVHSYYSTDKGLLRFTLSMPKAK